MDLLHLVDRLEELVAGAQKMPIGNRAILDRRRVLDLIDQMRVAIPHEVREAQDIVAQREAIRRDAEEDGRIIVAQAEERASEMIEEHAITDAARRRAEEIATEAERRLEMRIEEANSDIQRRIQESRRLAREQMEAADEYARELLVRLDRQLQAFQSSVRAGVQQLEPHAPSFADALPPLDDQGLYDDEPEVARAPRGGVSRETPRQPVPPPYPAYEPAPSRGGLGRQDAGDDSELDNLLRPRSGTQERDEMEPGVIDDFELEPLDDDPMLRPPSRLGYDERDEGGENYR